MATPSLHGHAKASSDATEWQARVDLAACFRLVALHGWDDFWQPIFPRECPASAMSFWSIRWG